MISFLPSSSVGINELQKYTFFRKNDYFCRAKTYYHFQQIINIIYRMQHLYTIGLLVVSNIFMTFAWYGHLKLQQIKVFTDNTPLYVIILLSWMLALPEYTCQVPANRIGYEGNGGPFNLMQLKDNLVLIRFYVQCVAVIMPIFCVI